ncbi:hypothetical protein K0M31_007456 [Melipona bicolor]|uniref:Odorant-binding protein n=1 Tax=Melipona bicolor TaxID=60889 RepID=A0AA40GCV9_9HYME|nr:hypothetical protein K0M31_007456 [Melipona bicolor]
MKIILAVFCLLLTVIASRADIVDIYVEVANDALLECGKENGFTEDSARVIFDKDSETGLENSSCLKACVLKKMGMLKDSKFNLKAMKDFIGLVHKDEPEVMKDGFQHVDYCNEKVKDMADDCKKAYGITACYLEKISA